MRARQRAEVLGHRRFREALRTRVPTRRLARALRACGHPVCTGGRDENEIVQITYPSHGKSAIQNESEKH